MFTPMFDNLDIRVSDSDIRELWDAHDREILTLGYMVITTPAEEIISKPWISDYYTGRRDEVRQLRESIDCLVVICDRQRFEW